jgi:hypothetical protein
MKKLTFALWFLAVIPFAHGGNDNGTSAPQMAEKAMGLYLSACEGEPVAYDLSQYVFEKTASFSSKDLPKWLTLSSDGLLESASARRGNHAFHFENSEGEVREAVLSVIRCDGRKPLVFERRVGREMHLDLRRLFRRFGRHEIVSADPGFALRGSTLILPATDDAPAEHHLTLAFTRPWGCRREYRLILRVEP